MKAQRLILVALLIILALTSSISASVPLKASTIDGTTKLRIKSIAGYYGIAEAELAPLLEAGLSIDQVKAYLNGLYPLEGFRIDTDACNTLSRKTGLSMKDAIRCLQMAVRFGKDPEVLAGIYLNDATWERLEEALLKYSRSTNAVSMMTSGKGGKG